MTAIPSQISGVILPSGRLAVESCEPALNPQAARARKRQAAGPPAQNLHLPPHLREVCSILAAGLLRLGSRTSADIDRGPQDSGESSLHFTAEQSVCATRTNRRAA
jgi:hypothetical protein